LSGNLFAQFNPFKETSEEKFSASQKFIRNHAPTDYKIYQFDLNKVLDWVQDAPELSDKPSRLILTLPDANGEMANYWIYNNSVMDGALAENLSTIKSLKAVHTKKNGTILSISISDIFGFHGMGMKTDGSIFYMNNYSNDLNNIIVYNRNSLELPKNNFMCLVTSKDSSENTTINNTPIQTLSFDSNRRNYRLALACTTEYAAFHINNAPIGTPKNTLDQKKNIVLAAMNVTLTRLNQILERELNVHLNLIANNKDIIFVDTDNFNNDNANVLISQSQTVIDNIIKTANYDIGHTFSTGAGGLASFESVCNPIKKASGITGSPSPVGDPYDVDYVAHEIGHQFGAHHTFNNLCLFNIDSITAVEVGSGTTIMSYAGICAPDVQNNVDAYYHYVSIREMQNFLQTATCAQQLTSTNSAPVVAPIIPKTIPYGTPFILSTTATDIDNDLLTYTFEQIDTQFSVQPPVENATAGPAFRSVIPTTNNFRSFPSLATVLDGTTFNTGIVSTTWERLATVGRNYNFVATVRDNNPASARVVYTQPVTITVANVGPFVITAPNNNPTTTEPVWFMGSAKTITWNVAGTTANSINVSNVNILISTDNGLSYTNLVANAPNTGSATVTIPTNLTSTYDARIKIEAVGNIFYTVSKKFTLWDPNLSGQEVSITDLKIYPNPTTNILNIEFTTKNTENIKFDIFDLNGRLIKTVSQENSNQINQQINVESLTNGTYILVINTEKHTSTHKFIKK